MLSSYDLHPLLNMRPALLGLVMLDSSCAAPTIHQHGPDMAAACMSFMRVCRFQDIGAAVHALQAAAARARADIMAPYDSVCTWAGICAMSLPLQLKA